MADTIASPAPSPPPQQSTSHPLGIFNIHTSYLHHLSTPLPPALAAISTLISALPLHPLHTISETLALLSQLSNTLLSSLKHPLSASAGTDLFQRWLVTTLQRQRQRQPNGLHTSTTDSRHDGSPDPDFQSILDTITSAGRAFITAGLSARSRLASYGHRLIREDATVIVPCASDTVDALLIDAAEAGVRFQVVFVASRPSSSSSSPTTSRRNPRNRPRALTKLLREKAIPTCTIPPTALAHTLSSLLHQPPHPQTSQLHPKSTILLAGAAALLSNGGILAPLGTQQAAVVARAMGVPFYAAGEAFRCIRWNGSAGSEGGQGERFDKGVRFTEDGEDGVEEQDEAEDEEEQEGEKMDVTRPELVTGIVTENGVVGPAAIAEEAIRIWF